MNGVAGADNQEMRDVTAHYVLQLSLMEVGLGSFLHAFHIPFSGSFLSLNQCYVLNRATILAANSASPIPTLRFLPMTISNSAAIIKTLSPYGKKLTPMLAISIQGVLFNTGLLSFGRNFFGRCAASLLLILWPMLQPLLLYGVLFSLFNAQTDAAKTNLELLAIIYIVTHFLLALIVCFLTSVMPSRLLNRYDLYMSSRQAPLLKNASEPIKHGLKETLQGIVKDLSSPLFLSSFLLSGLLCFLTFQSLSESFLFLFRFIAMAFLTFFLLRNLSTKACVHFFSNQAFLKKYTPYVEQVLYRIKQDQQPS